jgi:NDP-sugar pyrophosphorylase family protein
MVMTAGLGTRLRPLTDFRAKPALPVGRQAMIRRILAWAASHGVTDAVMNLHHRPESITAVVGDGRDLGLAVRYSWELPQILGSAGGPRLALPIVGAESFFLINGDTLTDLSLAELADVHAAARALVTLAVVPNHEFMKYGGVVADKSGVVAGFVARGPNAENSWHFVGVQAVAASVFAAVPARTPARSIGGVYDSLIRTHPGSVRIHRGEWQFFDVGSPADYLRTVNALSPAAIEPGRRAVIDPSARLTRAILWDDVEVGANVVLQDCVVTDGVRVPAGSVYTRSILMMNGEAVSAVPIESR